MKKKIIFTLFFSIAIIFSSCSNPSEYDVQTKHDEPEYLYRIVAENDLMGYINNKGAVVIEPIYQAASDFSDGYALVTLNASGLQAMPYDEYIDYIQENELAWFYINTEGKNVFDKTFKRAMPFSNGRAYAETHDGRTVLIDTEGTEVFCFDDNPGWDFSIAEGVLWKCGDLPTGTNYADEFSNGLAAIGVYREDYYYTLSFIDKDVNVILETDYYYSYDGLDMPFYFGDGLVCVYKFFKDDIESYNWFDGSKQKYGYINKTGEVVIPFIYDYALPFSEGLAAVRLEEGGLEGYIDTSGNMVIEPQFETATSFYEGVAKVYKLNPEPTYPYNEYLIGFIDKTGKLIIDYQYEEFYTTMYYYGVNSYMHNGLIEVLYHRFEDDEWRGYINAKGEIIYKNK